MAKYKGYDFCGWATRNDLRCSDGRTIRRGAFSHQDGQRVPLVWGHNHETPEAVIGHGYLEDRPEGVFIYGYFNDGELAQAARRDVEHGDITALSIWANQLQQKAGDVLHGSIKEVSLVLSGANMGAQITYPVVVHGEDCETLTDEAYITLGDEFRLMLSHADDSDDDEDTENEDAEEDNNKGDTDMKDDLTVQDVLDTMDEEQLKAASFLIAGGDAGEVQEVLATMNDDQLKVVGFLVDQAEQDDDEDDDEVEHDDMDDDMTVDDVLDTMNDDQLDVVNYLIDSAVEDTLDEVAETEGDLEHYDFGGDFMNFNAFEGAYDNTEFLSHADQVNIIENAKSLGSLKKALQVYAEENKLQHDDLAPVSGFGSYPVGGAPAVVDSLFPEWHDVRPGAPEIVTNDQAWVKAVLNGVHRSPYSRIRTSQVDLRNIEALRAKGYQKGMEKTLAANYTVAKRTTEPQTVYVKSALNRDDITDITDFDYLAYQYKIDRMTLEKELAQAILIGDGRAAESDDKIEPDKIRPVWTDSDIFTIHKALDITGTPNGTNTAANFGAGYLYAQAAEEAILNAKIDYRGSGALTMFTDQGFFNKMLLAKDLNGRRLYNNKNELMSALDVTNVFNVPEFQGKTRVVGEGTSAKTYKLLAILLNLGDYNIGATKGGEITSFSQFDIDFNQQKTLLEGRFSGANTRILSAIVLEEEVTE